MSQVDTGKDHLLAHTADGVAYLVVNRPHAEYQRRSPHAWLLAPGLFMGLLWSAAVTAAQLDWFNVLGGPGYDEIFDIATDATDVYVAGRVKEALPGQSAGFDLDAFVRKLDSAGRAVWTRQFELADAGGRSVEEAFSIAVDDLGIYIAGRFECLSGCSLGTFAAFVAHFDRNGSLIWQRALADMHQAWRIVAHGGALYVAGDRIGTTDPSAVIVKLDLDGHPLWTYAPGGQGSFADIAVDDTGIYGVGSIGDIAVQPLDLNGLPLAPIGADGFSARRLVHDSSGLYAIGRGPLSVTDYQLRKYSRSGALLWQRALVLQPGSIDVDGDGVLLGQQVASGYDGYVSRYTRGGDFVWRCAIGERVGLYAGAVQDGGLLLTGARFGATERETDSFLARVSFRHPPQFRSLGTINGTAAIAVLVHLDHPSRYMIKIRDVRSRALLNRFDVTANGHPQDLLVLPDLSGNGAPELALLGIRSPSGDMAAEIRDALTGAKLGSVPFDKRYSPTQFAAAPGVSAAEPVLIVLGDSSVDRQLHAQIRSAVGGTPTASVNFDRYYYVNPFSALSVLPDVNGNGSPELAVALFRRSDPIFAGVDVPVTVKEAVTGATVTDFTPERNHALLDMTTLPDLNSNGSADLAFLELGINRRGIRAAVRDGRTGRLLRNVYYGKRGRSTQLIVVPDLNGNGTVEAGVLALDVIPDTDTVEIKDLSTTASIRKLWFPHRGWTQRGVEVVPDLNDNGSAEVAQLQQNQADGRVRVLIKDARTGALVHYMGI